MGNARSAARCVCAGAAAFDALSRSGADGGLISRVASDIDAVQTVIVFGLLGVLVNIVTLVGMIGVMFYLNWHFTLIAVVPVLFAIVYTCTRWVKKASRDVRKREGKMISIVVEVVSSIRVVKAFAREE